MKNVGRNLKVQMKRTDTLSIDPRMLKSTWEMQDWLSRQTSGLVYTNTRGGRAGMCVKGFILKLEEPNSSRRIEPWWTCNTWPAVPTENEEFTFQIIGINTPIRPKSIQINKLFLASNHQHRCSLSSCEGQSHPVTHARCKTGAMGIYLYAYTVCIGGNRLENLFT